MKINFYLDRSKTPTGTKRVELKDDASLIKIEKCVVCSAPLEEVIRLKTATSEHSLSRGFCTQCGYFGISRSFSPEWVQNYYSSAWTNDPETDQIERASEVTNPVPSSFLSKYLPQKDAVILDAGAGYGTSLRGFLKQGYHAMEAIELSERRYRLLKDRYPNLKIDHVPIQKIAESKILSRQFDAIYLWHVFEHLTDLPSCLNALQAAIKDNGYLFIAVPRFEGEPFPFLVNMHVHLHSFQPHTLKYLLSQYGFVLVEENSNFDSYGIRMIFKKIKSANPVELGSLPSPAVNRSVYHEKIFKDYKLMYLAHQPEWTHKNVLIGFHPTAAFAGSNLQRHPLKASEAILYRLWARAHDARAKKVSFWTRLGTHVTNRLMKKMALPYVSLLFKEISGIPNQDDLLNIFNTDQLIRADFICENDTLNFWME